MPPRKSDCSTRMKMPHALAMLWSMNRTLKASAVIAASLLLAACGTMRSSVVVEPAGSSSHGRYPDAHAHARTTIPGGSYAVKHGDTLYSIAYRNGVDFLDMAQLNGISAPYTIWPGQQLRLSPAARSHATRPAPASGFGHAPAPAVAPTAPAFRPVPSSPPSSSNAMVRTAAVPSPPMHPAVAATTSVVPVAGVPPVAPTSVPPPMPAAAVAPGASRQISGVAWRWPAQGSLIKRFQAADAIPGIEIAGNAGDPVRAAADGVVVYSGNGLVGYGELVIIKHSDTFLSAYGHNSKRLVKEGQRVTAGQPIAEMGSTGASRNELEFQIRKNGNPVDPLDYLPAR